MLFRLIAATGLRISEALHIKRANMNWADFSIKILGRDSRERIIYSGIERLKLLLEQLVRMSRELGIESPSRQPTENTMNTPKTIMAIQSSEQAIHNSLLNRSGLCGSPVIRFVDGLWSSYLLDGPSHCLRLLELSRRYSRARLEQAYRRAMYYGHGNYRTVRRILRLGIEYLPQTPQTDVWGRLW